MKMKRIGKNGKYPYPHGCTYTYCAFGGGTNTFPFATTLCATPAFYATTAIPPATSNASNVAMMKRPRSSDAMTFPPADQCRAGL